MGTPFLGQRAILCHPRGEACLAALVTAVRDDGTVNLCVLRANGETDKRTAVPIGAQEGFYCLLSDEAELSHEVNLAHSLISELQSKVALLSDAVDKLSAPKGTGGILPPPVAPTV